MHPTPDSRPWTIVLAGGDGTRLKELTRALHGTDLPKQFATLQEGRSLLQSTLERSLELSPAERHVVVVPERYRGLAREQAFALAPVEVIDQPRNLGTGPGILLPLERILARDPDAHVVVLPSDHYVRVSAPFLSTLRSADAAARSTGSLVLVGAVPEQPETEYGWIVPEPAPRTGTLFVRRFVEKPDPDRAMALLRSGALWNTLVMAAPAQTLKRLFQRHLPDQCLDMAPYCEVIGTRAEHNALARVYERLEPASFSHEVLERAQDLRTVKLSPCGWSDWGTPGRVLSSLRGMRDYDRVVQRLTAASEHDALALLAAAAV